MVKVMSSCTYDRLQNLELDKQLRKCVSFIKALALFISFSFFFQCGRKGHWPGFYYNDIILMIRISENVNV